MMHTGARECKGPGHGSILYLFRTVLCITVSVSAGVTERGTAAAQHPKRRRGGSPVVPARPRVGPNQGMPKTIGSRTQRRRRRPVLRAASEYQHQIGRCWWPSQNVPWTSATATTRNLAAHAMHETARNPGASPDVHLENRKIDKVGFM